MYIADMPFTSAMAKYMPESQSIYFNKDLDLESLNTIAAIHECLHYIQRKQCKSNNRLGLADLNKKRWFFLLY